MTGKKKIIIIEDDNDLLETLGILLEEEGYKVWKYTNAKVAYKKLEKISPDTMVVDLMLPDINGDELTSYVKNREEFKNTKVILISADESVEKSARDAKADGFLKKPFAFDRLLSMV